MNNESIKFDLAGSVKVLKTAILQAQHTVASDANRVMLMLYLGIGRFISQKTRNGALGNRCGSSHCRTVAERNARSQRV